MPNQNERIIKALKDIQAGKISKNVIRHVKENIVLIHESENLIDSIKYSEDEFEMLSNYLRNELKSVCIFFSGKDECKNVSLMDKLKNG